MTYKEKLRQEHPDLVNNNKFIGGCSGCPSDYGYEPPHDKKKCTHELCESCWNREMEIKNGKNEV